MQRPAYMDVLVCSTQMVDMHTAGLLMVNRVYALAVRVEWRHVAEWPILLVILLSK